MRKIVRIVGVGLLAAGVTACSSATSPVSPAVATSSTEATTAGVAARPGSTTIVDIVLQDDGEFDVLQAAVVRAGLVDALSGNRQLTVFAPTDAAFVSTLQAANEAAAIAAVNAMDVDTLRNILLYHVTSGRRSSTSVLAAPSYRMLSGARLTQEQLVQAGILATDISASNGVVHVIGGVLLP